MNHDGSLKMFVNTLSWCQNTCTIFFQKVVICYARFIGNTYFFHITITIISGVVICVISFLAGLGVCLLDKKAESKLENASKQKKSA